MVGGAIGGIAAGLGYYSTEGSASGLGFWGTVGAGAIVGAGAAYVPTTWGIYGALASGAAAGFLGDSLGQYVGHEVKNSDSGSCSKFDWNWQQSLTQGAVGASAGGIGYGGATFALWINGAIPGALSDGAVGAAAAGTTQINVNNLLPTNLGGYAPVH